MIELLIIGWVACGITAYGFMVAYNQREFRLIAHKFRVEDRVLAATIALGGPFALWACLITGDYKHGWML